MRRLGLLLAGAGLWLFLAAVPALADGGPHVVSVNSGTATLTADSCAGCHRAHTAQGEFLLAAQSEEALCLSCHNGTGATTNVLDGVQMIPTGVVGAGTELGALRDGGFENARIDNADPSRMNYIRGYEDSPYNLIYAISSRPKVEVLGTGQAVNSAHIDLVADAGTPDGIADTAVLWGKGTQANGTGTPTVTLTCVECHNPHGNGQYRILRPVPGIEASPLGSPVAVDIKAAYSNFDTLVTDTQHGLVVWDEVTVTGVTGLPGTNPYYVQTVTNGFTFKVADDLGGSALDITLDFSAGGATVYRPEVAVADFPADPNGNGVIAGDETKNYTVIQTKGSQGVASTYLLYASDVVDAAAGSGVAADQPAVTIDDAVTASGTTYLQTTGVAHGLAVGDLVTITGTPGGVAAGTYTVGAVSSSAAVYDRFTLVGQTITAGATTGTVAREGIPGVYTAMGGDYFRRLLPWNPNLVNPSCSNSTFSSANSAYCGTANDAPNGRPNTITSGPSTLLGQQAFLDQMSTWCMQCHTRYYSASNENVAGDPPISTIANRGIGRTTAADEIYPLYYSATSTQFGGPSYGDRVTFSGTGTALDTNPAGGWYVIATGSSSGRSWFKVSATQAGTAVDLANAGVSPYDVPLNYSAGPPVVPGAMFTRTYQSSNSSWGYPRSDGGVEDATYKYQHSTASNRGCTVCHVSHGSNAEMNGTFSLDVPYPDGTTTSTSSRLLKVDNRGTCQLCHEPTGTVPAGTLLPNPGGSTSVP